MQSLFERALLEHHSKHLALIESIWNVVCDHTPLQPLLISTCPLYGHWLIMVMGPPSAALQLIATPQHRPHGGTSGGGGSLYLGGPEAQHSPEFGERQRL